MSTVDRVLTPPSEVYEFLIDPKTVQAAQASLNPVLDLARRTQAGFFRANKQNPLSRTIACFPHASNPKEDKLFVLMTKTAKNDVPLAIIPGKKRLKIALMIKRGVLEEPLSKEGLAPYIVTVQRMNEVIDQTLTPSVLAQEEAAVRDEWNNKCKMYEELRGCTRVALPEYSIWSEDGKKLYHFQPYYPEGDLHTFLSSAKWLELSLNGRVDLFRDQVLGAHELHRKGFAHLDLKPENVFLKWQREVLQGFIGDLDEIRELDALDDDWFILGNREYHPPESHRPDRRQDKTKYDAWALGCILYEICTQSQVQEYAPSADPARVQPILNRMKAEMRNKALAFLVPLAMKLLEIDPRQRLSLEDALYYLAPENRTRLKALRPNDPLWARESQQAAGAAGSAASSNPDTTEPSQPARKLARPAATAPKKSGDPAGLHSRRKSDLRLEEDDSD